MFYRGYSLKDRISIEFALTWAKGQLKDAGIPNTKDAEFILAEIIKTNVADFRLRDTLTSKQVKMYDRAILKRCKHVPLDKIVGYTDFMDICIPFSKHTLTPRQETEIMVDDIVRAYKGKKPSVLDLCSGSGCIGIAIAKELNTQVTLSDISKKANKVATNNAKLNGVNVNIIRSDLFDNIPTKFDIIISNPPYIKRKDLKSLEIEVRDFDPRISLDGGDDGLDFYREIIDKAPSYLNDGGMLYLEIGIDQSKDIVKMLNKDFEDVVVKKDYAKIDRYIIAKKRDKNVK